jgi:hypothetical protein
MFEHSITVLYVPTTARKYYVVYFFRATKTRLDSTLSNRSGKALVTTVITTPVATTRTVLLYYSSRATLATVAS